MVEPSRLQMPVWCMRIECWIPKATNTHSKRVIIFVFPRQHWLYECSSLLHYTYFVCLVIPVNESSAIRFHAVYVRYITFLTSYNSMVFRLIQCHNVLRVWELRCSGLLRSEYYHFPPFVNTTRRVTTQKSAVLGYFAAEAWNHACCEYAVKSNVSVWLVAGNTERPALCKCL